METKLLPILIEMREHGIRVDMAKAEVMKKTFVLEEKKKLHEIKGFNRN